jgi:Winged helix-turn helix
LVGLASFVVASSLGVSLVLLVRLLRRGRKRQNMTIEQAHTGGVLVVGQIKAPLDKRLGQAVGLSSTYNLVHRHNGRKRVPDKRHPQSDPLAQEQWKENSPKSSAKSSKTGPQANPSS